MCFAGELEKQQGTKNLSLRTNGAQMELQSKQGSPTGKKTPSTQLFWSRIAAFANMFSLVSVRTTAKRSVQFCALYLWPNSGNTRAYTFFKYLRKTLEVSLPSV